MDLETENRIAAILMREAAELRREAARDGIDAYLRPNVRVRPNSRFLTATVVGVQQSNRAVEVNEMWRAREKEKELDKKGGTRRFEEDYERKHTSSSKSAIEGGLGNNEIEEFLHSRAKRGRGTIGPRMDETGPYPPDSEGIDMGYRDRESRAILGPEKPLNLKSDSEERERKAKRSKHDRRKHKSRIDEKKKKKKRSKHHK